MSRKRANVFVMTSVVLAGLSYPSVHAMAEYVAPEEYTTQWKKQQRRDELLGCGLCLGTLAVCGPLAAAEVVSLNVALPAIACGCFAYTWYGGKRLGNPCCSYRTACNCLDQMEAVDFSKESDAALDYTYPYQLCEPWRLIEYMARCGDFTEDERAEIERNRQRCETLSAAIWRESNSRPHVMD